MTATVLSSNSIDRRCDAHLGKTSFSFLFHASQSASPDYISLVSSNLLFQYPFAFSADQ
jgi:hypothetical protein